MNISVITKSNVTDTKRLVVNQVQAKCPITNLEELGYIATNAHIALATFREVPFNPDWTSDEEVMTRCNGINAMWKYLANVEQVQFLAFDFDNGIHSAKSVHEQVKAHRHIILASKNHLVDKGDGKGVVERFHLFIQMASPLTDTNLYKFIGTTFASKLHWQHDQSIIEASRYFYQHKEVLYLHNNGSPLQTQPYQMMQRMNEQRVKQFGKTRPNGMKDVPSLEQLKKSRWFNRDIEPLLCPGSYHQAQLKMITFLKKLGYSRQDAVGFALDAKGACEATDYDKYCGTYDKAK